MPDENRVFDISKPGRSQPQATSKPVIVGHHPVISDPMVKEKEETPAPSKIAVYHDEPAPKKDELLVPAGTAAAPEPEPMQHHDIPVYNPSVPEMTPEHSTTSEAAAPAVFDTPPEPPAANDPLVPPPGAESAFGHQAAGPIETRPLEPAAPPPGHVEALRPSPNMKRRSPLKWILLVLLLALAAAYILVGTGTIKTGLTLPPFKKPAPASPPASQAQPNPPSALPAGFTQYNLAGTNVTFAAPTGWGTPTSTTDPGYTKRGGQNKSDGNHAYIVDFPNNKDVELAVTAAKYLPAVRDSQYYDYLQWCTGTADGKYYFGALQFNTAADKTDTPTTEVCNQGPLTGVTQLDSSTIVQLSVKNSGGQVIGDLYTKNLNNADLPVVRIKDAKSANAVQIKQMLKTFKVPA